MSPAIVTDPHRARWAYTERRADFIVHQGGFQKLPSGVRSVGLKILKNKLSEYVRLAARGETVLVTDRDRVVAELGPPREGRSEWLADAHLAGMVRDGVLRPPLVPRDVVPPRKPIGPTEEVLRELDRDRGER